MDPSDRFALSRPSCSRRSLLALAPAWLIGGLQIAGAEERALPPELSAYLAEVAPTALLVKRDGQLVASHGDPARKVNAASVRKSLLGALYGIAVAEGRIRLSDTLETLGIDDLAPSLSAMEKQATVADLLAARSGVYHVAAYETGEIRKSRPKRESHAPGSFWFYNNWDFNALGTIYLRRSGEDIFESFERRIAKPVGMRDFVASDGRYVGDPHTLHKAYVFLLSARDALRFGELVLAEGHWQGREIVPGAWLKQSLTARSRTDRGDLGYGYLWWTLDPGVFGPGAGFAAGYGGQFIAVVPRHRLVVAQTIARRLAAGGGATRRFVGLLKSLVIG